MFTEFTTTRMPSRKIKKPERRPRKIDPPSAPQQLSRGSLNSRKEDGQHIAAALGGDQAAFKRLMKKYHDQIANLIYRIIHQKEHVEDLTQEVFIKAFASLKSFNDEYAFSTWLYKIATNSSIDFIRKKKLHTFSIDKPVAADETEYSFELPDTTYEPD